MESYQITTWGRSLERREYETPEPRGTEVLLRVEGCGVCHSDLHIWDGYFDLGGGKRIALERGLELPFTMGHEIVGEVAALGPEATGVAVGDRRVVYPWIGCGACDVCVRGKELLCDKPRALGANTHGGYSDYVVVPDPRYLVDYEGIPTELACTYACSGITAYGALKKARDRGPDDDLLIIGAGGVGLSAVHFAPAVVAGRVVVADVDAGKRDAALRAGAAEAIDNADPEAGRQLRKLTGGGVSTAIDFVGRPETAKFGFDALRRGGTLVIVGLFGDALPLPLPMLPLKMATITGSYVGTLQDLKDVIALVQAGKVPPIPVEKRPLAEVEAALEDLKAGNIVGRVVVAP